MADRQEHLSRISRYQAALSERGLSGALLLNAVDVLYLAGTRQNGALTPESYTNVSTFVAWSRPR